MLSHTRIRARRSKPAPPKLTKASITQNPSRVTTSSHAERPFRLVSGEGMRHLWRAAGAPSAQAVGWLQRPRRSRAVESEQARRPPRKARLLRGALAGVGRSVVVGRGVACEAPSARRAGGTERAQLLGRSRARARRYPSKSLLAHQKSTSSPLHGQNSPPPTRPVSLWPPLALVLRIQSLL